MSTWYWELEHLEPRYLMSGATAIEAGTLCLSSTLNIQGTLSQGGLALSGQCVNCDAAALAQTNSVLVAPVQTNSAPVAQDVSQDTPSLDIGVALTGIQATGGKTVSTTISVLNFSDVAEVGAVNFTIYASASGQLDGSQILVQSFNRDENVANDGNTPDNFTENFALPGTLPAGNYYLIVQATPANSADTDPADNIAVSDQEIAVGAHGAATLLRNVDVGVNVDDVERCDGLNCTISLSLYNYGDSPDVGQVNFTVYASTDGQIDDQAVQIASFNRAESNLANDGSSSDDFSENVTLPSNLVPGDYYLVVQANPVGAVDIDPSDNVSCSQSPVTVNGTNIGVQMSDVQLAGGQISTTLSVYNYGDFADAGKVKFSVYLSASGQVDAQAVLVQSFIRDVNVANDGEATYNTQIDVSLPAGLAAGDYYLVVQANPLGAQDADPSDNVVCSQNTVTVYGTNIGVQLSNVQFGDNGQISSTISVYNNGDFPEVGKVKFSVYLSTSGQVDSQAVPLASFTQDVNVANDGQTTDDIQKTFAMPTGLGLGDYYLVVEADPVGVADADPSDNVACSNNTVHAAGTGKDIGVYLSNDQFGNNGQLTSTLSVVNNGASAEVGLVKFSIYLSVSGQVDDQAVFIKSFTRNENIVTDGQTTDDIPVNFALPAGLTPGDYYLVVQANPVGVGDDNPSDNVAYSPDTVTVRGTDIGASLSNSKVGVNGQVSTTISVVNNGDFPEVGLVKFSVYISASGQVDDQAVLLNTFTKVVNVANDGQTIEDIQADASLPAGLAAGDYYLLVEADPLGATDADPSDNLASDIVTLRGTDIGVYFAKLKAGANGQLSTTLSVFNYGDFNNVGQVNFTVYLSASGQVDDQAVVLKTFTQNVTVASDGQTSCDIQKNLSLPAGLAPGDYYLLVEADPVGGNDTNPSNNLGTSDVLTVAQDGSVTIQSTVNIGVAADDAQFGDKPNVSTTIYVYNYGSLSNVGQVNFTVYLSASGQVDDQAVFIKSFTQNVNIGNDGQSSDDIPVNFTLPGGLVGGDYYLVVEADTVGAANADPVSSVASSPDAVAVRGTNIGVGISNDQFGNGQATATINVYNNGDFAEVGPVKFSVYLSASGQVDDQAVFIKSFTQDVNVATDGCTSDDIPLNFSLPANLTPGDYYLVVEADPLAAQDADTSDNVACTQDAVTIRGTDVGVNFTAVGVGSDGQVTSTVSVVNNGDFPEVGLVKFTIYLSTTGQVDGQAVPVTSFTQDVNVANDGSTTDDIPENFSLPAILAAGDYYLVVEADPVGVTDANPSDNVSCWWNTEIVHGRDVGVAMSAPQVGGDGQVSTTISVVNNGDSAEVGMVQFTIYLSASGQVDGQAIPVTSFTQDVNIANDGQTTDDIPETFTLPAGLVAGQYYLVVQADTLDGADANPSDNVNSPYETLTVTPDGSVEITPILDIGDKLSTIHTADGSNFSVTVSMYNYSNVTDVGQVSFGIWLMPKYSSSSQAPILLQSDTQDVNVANDGGTSDDFQETFTLPQGLAAGDYTLSLQVSPTNGDGIPLGVFSDYDTADTSIVRVAQDGSASVVPIVNIGVYWGNVQSPDGSNISATVSVYNYGSQAEVGPVNFTVSATPVYTWGNGVCFNGLGGYQFQSDPIPVTSFTQDVNVANDGQTSDDIQQTFALPAGLAAGNYVLSVQATPAASDGLNLGYYNWAVQSNQMVTVGQDGSVTVAPQQNLGILGYPIIRTDPIVFDPIIWTRFGVYDPICLASTGIVGYNTPAVDSSGNVIQGSPSTGVSVGNQPTRVSYHSPANVASTVNPSGPLLNTSPTSAALAPALAASGTAGAAVDSSAPVISILAGAAIQANFQSPVATLVTPQPTPAYDAPSATASDGVVDLLAPASSDNADAGTSTFYHANHTASHAPIHKGA
jgi:hypothetical protein